MKKDKNKHKKSKGIIVKVRSIPGKTLLTNCTSTESKSEIANRPEIFEQYIERVNKLFGVYQIKEGDWKELAFVLALKYEPSLQLVPENNPAGRPISWHFMRQFFLWWDFQMVKRKYPSLSETAIFTSLKKQSAWKDFEVSSLRVAYHKHDVEKSQLVVTVLSMVEKMGWDEVAKVFSNWLENREVRLAEFDSL